MSGPGETFFADDTQWPFVTVTHVDGHRWLFMFCEHFGLDAPQIEAAPFFAPGTDPDPELTEQAARQATAKAQTRAGN